jgi:hypothetical protein
VDDRSRGRALTAIRLVHTATRAVVMLSIVYTLYCSIFQLRHLPAGLGVDAALAEPDRRGC